MAEEHLRELPRILERAAKVIEELSVPVSNPVINDSNESGVGQSRPERSQSSPSQHDLPASADPDSTEPYLELGPPTHNAIIEQPRLEPSEPSPAQSNILSGPDRTEPYGPARQLESLEATEAWAHHTNDLIELTQASKDLLVEVRFAKEAVRHCNVISGFYQLTRAQ